MKLVIAEKPSVAQSLATVIGATARKDGYLEGNGWRVSWCVGHLAGLADADSYDPKYAKWRYDDLPILPEHWQMVVGKDKKKQFDILKKLMNAPDVTEVVNACDAGREGELIFRSVYELAGCQKPMKRLWISSMEDSAIREGFANLRPGVDYDGLRDAALCRAKADWLVGINATRLFSVLYHRTLNIGRVMSPTLALIVQREVDIDTFKPIPFYTVALELPGLTVSGERMADKAAAEQLKEACQGVNVTIKKVECNGKAEQCQRRQRHGNRSDLARTKTQGHTIGKQRGNNGASGNRHGNAASPRNGSTQIDTHRRPCGTQYRIRQAKADERHINHRKQKINHALLPLDR